MKLQIDIDNKIIKLEGNPKLGELYEQLNKFFPDGSWKDYLLITNVTIEWINPIPVYPIINPVYPWWDYTTCDSSSYISGIYNVEVK